MTLSEKDIKRFWSHVDIRGDNECWKWKAAKSTAGYGNCWVNGQYIGAHRVAWQIANKREPREGYVIAHAPVICHNKLCCNPLHLSEKTRTENEADKELDGTRLRGDASWSHQNPERLPRGNDHWSRRHPEKVSRGKLHYSYLHPELSARGEKNGNTKLTQEQVDQIPELRKQGLLQRVIAKMFGVTQSHISGIERGTKRKKL